MNLLLPLLFLLLFFSCSDADDRFDLRSSLCEIGEIQLLPRNLKGHYGFEI